jgi:hypothetical protein
MPHVAGRIAVLAATAGAAALVIWWHRRSRRNSSPSQRWAVRLVGAKMGNLTRESLLKESMARRSTDHGPAGNSAADAMEATLGKFTAEHKAATRESRQQKGASSTHEPTPAEGTVSATCTCGGALGDVAPLSLTRNIHSREARRELQRRTGIFEWITVSDDDVRMACELEAVLPAWNGNARIDGHSKDEELNRARAEEFEQYFKREGLSPSNNELPFAACVALLRAMRLGPSDRLLDLGSARGRVVLTAAATTACAACAGVELSPSDHAGALKARELYLAAFAPVPHNVPEFYRSDLRDAPLANYNVFFCAIRGFAARSSVMNELLQKLLAIPQPPTAPPRRLVLAGFGLDTKLGGFEHRAVLKRAYAVRADSDSPSRAAVGHAPPTEHATESEKRAGKSVGGLALYGDSCGPRVLLEYEII